MQFIHYSKSDNNMWIEIKLGKVYLVNRVYEMKKYKELLINQVVEEENISVMLIPTLYKSDYIK